MFFSDSFKDTGIFQSLPFFRRQSHQVKHGSLPRLQDDIGFLTSRNLIPCDVFWRSHGVHKASCGHLVTSWLVTVLFQKRILATPGRAINAGSIRERLLRSVQCFFALSSCHPKGFHLSWVQSVQHSHFEFHFRKSPVYLVANNTSSNEKNLISTSLVQLLARRARILLAILLLPSSWTREILYTHSQGSGWIEGLGKKSKSSPPKKKKTWAAFRVIYAAASSVWCHAMPTPRMPWMPWHLQPPKTWNPKNRKKHIRRPTDLPGSLGRFFFGAKNWGFWNASKSELICSCWRSWGWPPLPVT